MNCKQGDLAIVVHSTAGNEGKIVRCLEFIGTDRDNEGCHMVGVDRWRVDRVLPTNARTLCDSVQDHRLRPLRDTDKPDEIPTRVPEKAFR
jgi:hypothetical protein